MATIAEVLTVVNQILDAMATRPDGGSWGEPADYSVLVRQDQPSGSGSSQFKVEDVPLTASTVLGRGASGDIAALSAANLQTVLNTSADDIVIGNAQLGTAGNTTGTTITTITNTGTTAGKDLTISAGSTTTNGNNIDGGDLILKSGGGDGTGTSSISFFSKNTNVDAATQRLLISDVISCGAPVGFTRGLYASGTDVTILYTLTQKAHIAMSGNVTNLTLKFPSVSGNFVLTVLQDGSTRTITNYIVHDSDGNSANNGGGTAGKVRWQGGDSAGSNPPDLTDGGNKTDVLSFYWDATLEICYGMASLNF